MRGNGADEDVSTDGNSSSVSSDVDSSFEDEESKPRAKKKKNRGKKRNMNMDYDEEDQWGDENDGPANYYCCDVKALTSRTLIIGLLVIFLIAGIATTIFVDAETKNYVSGFVFLDFIVLIVFGCCCGRSKKGRIVNITNNHIYSRRRNGGRRRGGRRGQNRIQDG
jgi:hypothetical protein